MFTFSLLRVLMSESNKNGSRKDDKTEAEELKNVNTFPHFVIFSF